MRDVLVVGSGPSGAQAAKEAIARGLTVMLLDVGNDDPATRDTIPRRPFSELRRTDPDQRRYLVGPYDAATLTSVRVGAQLTPPRQFITKDVDELLPFESETFAPLRSLALGGLGAGWGAGCVTFSEAELARAGLPADEMRPCYDAVAADIGISGDASDDTGSTLLRCAPVGDPLPLDTNARALLDTYASRREAARRHGLRMGRAPLAMLGTARTSDGVVREANPLHDMDFYSDATRSVYRPRYTIDELRSHPAFEYRGESLVTGFVERGDSVDVHVRPVRGGDSAPVSARRVILAAGALGTTRIVLASLGQYERRVPLLSNAYVYMPCVNLPMFGRPAADRRHSLSQLIGTLEREAAEDALYLSFYSYRSLLLYKLVKEMPLPPAAGLLAARLLLSSLTVVGVNFPEYPASGKWMSVHRRPDGSAEMRAEYASTGDELRWRRRAVRDTARALRAVRCVPFSAIEPGNGASIHYAGGLAVDGDAADPLSTDAAGRLRQAPNVYVGDSANWRFLPAKGPTLTMMANARRVARHVACSLRPE